MFSVCKAVALLSASKYALHRLVTVVELQARIRRRECAIIDIDASRESLPTCIQGLPCERRFSLHHAPGYLRRDRAPRSLRSRRRSQRPQCARRGHIRDTQHPRSVGRWVDSDGCCLGHGIAGKVYADGVQRALLCAMQTAHSSRIPPIVTRAPLARRS